MPESVEGPAFLKLTSGIRLEISDFLILGARGDRPVALDDAKSAVAERLARIERKRRGFLLRDLRSEQSTFVNGAKISEAWLQEGDEIHLGQASCRFTYLAQDLPSQNLGLKSKNMAWQTQLTKLGAVAASGFPLLILGSSGTGKEIIAEKVHSSSSRTSGPFLRVNCSALTETLIESELFGHVRGSFTGAISDRKGAFEAARGGTLFLDEIGDLPYGLQAKLLRALENNEIRAVGSDSTIQTDVRIIAATHQRLAEKIARGEFRQDLYYRLSVITITPPTLLDRMEDFDDLIYEFSRQYRVRFSFAAIQKLKKHKWPGNIRELKNTVARASAFFGRSLIEDEAIDQILDPVSRGSLLNLAETHGLQLPVIKEIERQIIIKRLAANHGNQRRTAADLGMPKSTLHDRLKVYHIDPHQFSQSQEETDPKA